VQVLGQVLQTLAALHDAGFAHRNIKPSNILQRVQQHDWMLFDFSASCPVGVALFITLDVCMHFRDP
jgi:serine/threonine protein kinase